MREANLGQVLGLVGGIVAIVVFQVPVEPVSDGWRWTGGVLIVTGLSMFSFFVVAPLAIDDQSPARFLALLLCIPLGPFLFIGFGIACLFPSLSFPRDRQAL